MHTDTKILSIKLVNQNLDILILLTNKSDLNKDVSTVKIKLFNLKKLIKLVDK